MTEVVVDASVVAKWFIPEQHHQPARSLRDASLEGRHDLLAPSLMPFEVLNALRFSGHYDGGRLIEAADALGKYGVELVPFRSVGPIAEVANAAGITAYDAAYVALAAGRAATVYTADATLMADLEGTDHADDITHICTY